MIIVTGGAGFIGSSFIGYLNSVQIYDILIIDNIKSVEKTNNIKNLKFKDIVDKGVFLKNLDQYLKKGTTYVMHLGACSNTLCQDKEYLKKNNFEYSKNLLLKCIELTIPFYYASSASVYGLGKKGFQEDFKNLDPINPYANSKFLFDQFVSQFINKNECPILGFRFFNVFGPNESHKKNMSSPVYKFYNQAKNQGIINIFNKFKSYQLNDYLRDFIYIDNAIHMMNDLISSKTSGIFNIGSGNANSFYQIACIIRDWFDKNYNKNINIEFINFPEELENQYQFFTQADLSFFKKFQKFENFLSFDESVIKCLDKLSNLDSKI